jgi:hypothetical protein
LGSRRFRTNGPTEELDSSPSGQISAWHVQIRAIVFSFIILSYGEMLFLRDFMLESWFFRLILGDVAWCLYWQCIWKKSQLFDRRPVAIQLLVVNTLLGIDQTFTSGRKWCLTPQALENMGTVCAKTPLDLYFTSR